MIQVHWIRVWRWPESLEDGVWISECPAIPGCVSQGDAREEAIPNLGEAMSGSACRTENASDRGNTGDRGRCLMPPLPTLSGKEVVRRPIIRMLCE